MWLLATGKQISEIAKEMGFSPSTVSTYRTRILRKLGLTSNAALVHYAVRHQLVGCHDADRDGHARRRIRFLCPRAAARLEGEDPARRRRAEEPVRAAGA